MDRTEYSRKSVCECPAAILVPFRSSCNFLFRPEPILFGSARWKSPSLPELVGEVGNLLSVLRHGDILQNVCRDFVVSCGRGLPWSFHLIQIPNCTSELPCYTGVKYW